MSKPYYRDLYYRQPLPTTDQIALGGPARPPMPTPAQPTNPALLLYDDKTLQRVTSLHLHGLNQLDQQLESTRIEYINDNNNKIIPEFDRHLMLVEGPQLPVRLAAQFVKPIETKSNMGMSPM
jgi:hypothetical protein